MMVIARDSHSDRSGTYQVLRGSTKQSPQLTQNFCKNSEFLSFFVLYSRLLADFLSHLGNVVISREGLAPGTQDIKETSANKQSRALNLLIIKL